MGKEAINHQPPSPPHSHNGDLGQYAGRSDQYRGLHTPPRSVRPASASHAGTMPLYAYDSPSIYPPIPQQAQYTQQPAFVRQTNYHTPPSMADPGIMTRSGKTLGSPIAPKHQLGTESRSPRPRKTRNTKSGKKGLPVINQPLSVLTRDYQIPVRDMGAWVNRSVEERLREVEKKKGYISRPMNSFMLYRSAYADRVKQFCKENNHQVVSQVTGQSWPMEPPHIREMYERFAVLERDNHSAAHPTYKFAPNKTGKKRGRDDDESDSDDEWRGPGSSKRSRQGTGGETRSSSSTPFESSRAGRFQVLPYLSQPEPHPSSYQAVNPHGPPTFGFGSHAGMSSGFYQPQPQAMSYREHVDYVGFGHPDGFPIPGYDAGSQLIGMPDSAGYGLLAGTDNMAENIVHEPILDPQLAHFDPEYPYGHFNGVVDTSFLDPQHYGYNTFVAPSSAAQIAEQMHPGMVTLTEGWTDNIGPGSDFDSELRNWA